MITDFLFFVFAVMAVAAALAMIVSRNPVASLMFLVMVFFAISGIFVLLDAHFIAALQIIVYAGAIMVLFLFVIMLLNLGHGRMSDRRGSLAAAGAGAVGTALFVLLATLIQSGERPRLAGGMGEETVMAMLQARGAVGAVAEPLFVSYMVPFQVTGLLLLVAMVGAIVLARKKAP
ncbi:MAG: NADH-quinone oxidoreductase subunit J [Gemmatimonadota bacterium]